VPVVVGEASFRGSLPVDGMISGQLSPNGGNLSVSQKRRGANGESAPELSGEIRFRDMLRVNGHVAGKILSEKGTLIIDAAARVDADIEVAIAIISGTVIGRVTASERVELNSQAIINGNISTRALSIRPGAVFHGDCCMIKDVREREL
jgi:cytoskeletal protein CcmA (bactofilin family)